VDVFTEFLTAHFWVAAGQIVIIDILLGGDNAVVIALACRKLDPHQRTKGIILGTAAAIVLRVILIVFAMALLGIPYLKFVGALLLVWIGVKLIAPETDSHHEVQAADRLWSAVKTIVVADVVMSLDNVIGIAAAAQQAGEKHEVILVVFGLLLSVPIIVLGSQLVLKLMERFPVIITLGGMLLGWIAGGMLQTDAALAPWLPQDGAWPYVFGVAGAVLVLLLGRGVQKWRSKSRPIRS
jgi:YjbE family integral membrane protein